MNNNTDNNKHNIYKSYISNSISMPYIYSHKDIIASEQEYNPILQKYKNPLIEKSYIQEEKNNLKRNLSFNYDKCLNNIQTYNIINLDNRLKSLNYDPKNYIKKGIFKKYSDSNVDYNIISNLSKELHNNKSSENITEIKKEKENYNQYKINLNIYKDYDIISNKYKEFDKEKQEIDNEINRLIAAKKINSIKEPEEVNPFKRKQIKIKELYNPINFKIYNKEKLDEIDNLKNRNLRYSLKPKIENYYHSKDFINNSLPLPFPDYNKYKYIDKRGYDIINLKPCYNKYKDNFNMKKIKNEWNSIINNLGENETISKSKLYEVNKNQEDLDECHRNYVKNRNVEYIDFNNNKIKKNLKLFHKSQNENISNNLQWNKKNWFKDNNKSLELNENNVKKIGKEKIFYL
jgi:hypothetical protein